MSLFRKKPLVERNVNFAGWNRGGTANGSTIDNALRVVPVYAATSLIADQIAASPWSVFRKGSGAPVRLATQPLLTSNPGVGLDLYSWKFQMMSSLLLRGNAFGLILDQDSRGVPSKVQWLKPDDVKADESGPRPVFEYQGKQIPTDTLIHIPGYVLPGSVLGLSPITLFRLQVETGMQAQEFGSRHFNSGTIPSGHLRNTSKTLLPADAAAIKSRFVASVSSAEPFVSGNDWEYTPMTVTNGDMQFLAGIKATANQIAAAYRVAPEDVGGEAGGSSLTYKSLEQDQIRFAIRTLRPWTSRLEAVLSSYLPKNEYVKTNLDAGVRADLKTRYESHQIAIDAGFSTVDEVRALEERAPLTAAEIATYMEITHSGKPATASGK